MTEQSAEMCFGQSDLLNIEYPTIVSPNATVPLLTASKATALEGTTSAPTIDSMTVL